MKTIQEKIKIILVRDVDETEQGYRNAIANILELADEIYDYKCDKEDKEFISKQPKGQPIDKDVKDLGSIFGMKF